MQAMILAAGFGTRLQPYTNIRPKPLFPLLNIPLLLLTIQRLQDAGFDHIIVNSHHLKKQIRDVLFDISGIYLQEEDSILGTGGGLRLALDQMKDEPLLVTNGDIYHTVDYKEFYDSHIVSSAKITLAVHDFPRFNGLRVTSDRLLGFDKNIEGDLVAFTGLHIIDPNSLKTLSPNSKSCIIDHYRTILKAGGLINVQRVDESYWTDMGTPEDYLELHGELLQKRIPCWQQFQDKVDVPFYIAKDAVCGDHFAMKDWVCIGRAKIGKNVSVSRSVIWDNAVVPDNSIITDSLII